MRKNKYRLLNKAAYHLDRANYYLSKSKSSTLLKALGEAIDEIYKAWESFKE